MTEFLKSLRRGRGGHRDVFSDFAVQLLFAVAEQMARKRKKPRLRVVR